jgi:GNAT superfamily N-acetyltransferase
MIAPSADVAVIAALRHAAITVAYRGYFPHTPATRDRRAAGHMGAHLADPTAVALLASRDGQSAGSVMARADPQLGEGQIVGLRVLPPEWGHGIGSALHDAALAALSRAGYRIAGPWVIAANQRAWRMYENRGWAMPRSRKDDYGVIEVRYHRKLPAPAQDSNQVTQPRPAQTERPTQHQNNWGPNQLQIGCVLRVPKLYAP